MGMITRVASRYLYGEGPPPRWDEFLKARYDGGKKKVTNTNPKTKDRYPQVTMQTLFKSDEGFKKRVMKEYSDWLSGSSAGGSSPKEKKSMVPIPSRMLGTHADIDSYLEKHAATIQAAVEVFQAQTESRPITDGQVTPYELKAFTPEVQNLAVQSEKIGEMYQEFAGSSAKKFSMNIFEEWRRTNAKGIGRDLQSWIAGDDGAIPEEYHKALRDQYLFTQAFFKAAGITHVTVFRGVKGKGLDTDPPSEGDEIELGTRSLSCWSMDLNVAKWFGDRCCIATVPVEHVFASPLTDPHFGVSSARSECEFLIMPLKDKTTPIHLGGLHDGIL